MVTLRITGRDVLVDEPDLEAVTALRGWTVADCGSGKLYVRKAYRDQFEMRHTLYLHTFLTKWPLVDHVNGNGLDNRRQNLRPATSSQNGANRRIYESSTSGYKGVNFYKRTGRYRAHITTATVQRHLGYYDTAEEAARVYDAAAYAFWGEYAHLNFPTEQAA